MVSHRMRNIDIKNEKEKKSGNPWKGYECTCEESKLGVYEGTLCVGNWNCFVLSIESLFLRDFLTEEEQDIC